jgi:hypothetical protein
MLVLIGSSPSSGSTLLADLFDALPNYSCGPESKLFCYNELYTDYARFSKRINHRFAFATPSLQNWRGTFSKKERVLSAYGFTRKSVVEAAYAADRKETYIQQLHEAYQRKRGGDSKVWVEKYPENIFAAEAFLAAFPDYYFIQLVREPLYVYNSLRKNRGFSPTLAMATWLLAATAGYTLLNHPRCITLKYHELVTSPFPTMAQLAQQLSNDRYDPQAIQNNYEKNHYREQAEFRNTSWTASNYGSIRNANDVAIAPHIEEEYNAFGNITITAEYAALYGLKAVSIEKLCAHYGFTPPKNRFNTSAPPASSKRAFFAKFLVDFLYGTAKPKHLSAYLNPITSVGID